MTQYIFLSGFATRDEALACATSLKSAIRDQHNTHPNIAIEEFESPIREALISLTHHGSIPDTDLTDPTLLRAENLLGTTNGDAIEDLKEWLQESYGSEVVGRIALSYAEEVGEFFSYIIYIDTESPDWRAPFEELFFGSCHSFNLTSTPDDLVNQALNVLGLTERTAS